jgi:hypothetical protein
VSTSSAVDFCHSVTDRKKRYNSPRRTCVTAFQQVRSLLVEPVVRRPHRNQQSNELNFTRGIEIRGIKSQNHDNKSTYCEYYWGVNQNIPRIRMQHGTKSCRPNWEYAIISIVAKQIVGCKKKGSTNYRKKQLIEMRLG